MSYLKLIFLRAHWQILAMVYFPEWIDSDRLPLAARIYFPDWMDSDRLPLAARIYFPERMDSDRLPLKPFELSKDDG